jgi:hypothetical protein
VAGNVRECYQHRRAEVEAGSVQECLELAEWCLRQGLVDEAEREIAAAKALDATHPRIPLVETRLRLVRSKSNPVVPASAAEPATPLAKPRPAKRSPDVVVGNLSPGMVETFTNNIQPLLLNYCAGSGCHATQSASTMRLERIPPNRFAGRKTTQRNLRSVLAMIDRDNPLTSRLLTVPISLHGGRKTPIFTNRQQSQYRQLVAWVYHVAGTIRPAPEPTLEERTAPLLERGPDPTASPVDEDLIASDTSATAPPDSSTPPADEAHGSQTIGSYKNLPTRVPEDVPPGPGSQSGSPRQPPVTDRFVPKDSFDPEIFNRRFFSK